MHSVSVKEQLKQQYTSCMKVGTGGNLDLSREYHKKLFGPLFYSWWNCPLRLIHISHTISNILIYTSFVTSMLCLFLGLVCKAPNVSTNRRSTLLLC